LLTRDQITELQRLATFVQRWIQVRAPFDPPVVEIRQLAQLATIAANALELMPPRRLD